MRHPFNVTRFFPSPLPLLPLLSCLPQLVMIASWAFMPPNTNIIVGARYIMPTEDGSDPGVTTVDDARRFVDGKLAIALYLATALAWYGVQTGLFQAGDDVDRYSVCTLQATAAMSGVYPSACRPRSSFFRRPSVMPCFFFRLSRACLPAQRRLLRRLRRRVPLYELS